MSQTQNHLPGAFQIESNRWTHLPKSVTLVYDYGYRCANLAESVRHLQVHAGPSFNVPTEVVSTEAFDTRSAGQLAYAWGKSHKSGDLAIFNVAPGLNKPKGAIDNNRERLVGAIFESGAIAVATDSSDLVKFLALDKTVQVYDIGYNLNRKSQIRGRDSFPERALEWFQEASSGNIDPRRYERLDVTGKYSPLRPAWTFKHEAKPSSTVDAPSASRAGTRFVITDQGDSWRDYHSQTIPVATPRGNGLTAGFNAFQIALGGQLDQLSAKPVPAVAIIDIEASRQPGTPVWAQRYSHEFLVVGPADQDVWRTSGSAPVVDTGYVIGRTGSIEQIAEAVFNNPQLLDYRPTIDRSSIAFSPDEAKLLRFDDFGNGKSFIPNINRQRVGTVIPTVINNQSIAPQVLDRLFEKEIGTIGVTKSGSSGGWDIYFQDKAGRGYWAPLQVSEYIRRAGPESPYSIAGEVGLEKRDGVYPTIDINVGTPTLQRRPELASSSIAF